jgi:carnitine O-acetyltransferase
VWTVQFDATGKVSFDHIYTQPDPRAYFGTLSALDYRIPQLAKPHFRKLIDEYQDWRGGPHVNVLDIGCSYGINAALLKCDTTMDGLYERYLDDAIDRDVLAARDREWVRHNQTADTRFVGLDSSRPALAYARDAAFLDDVVHADLERDDLSEAQRAQLADIDLVVSTGCLGYVTEKTIAKVAAATERRPWMAHFVLRMFSFDPIAASLAEFGYETAHVDGVFKQRRFASHDEQAQVLDTLATAGVDPAGLETGGWLYARLHVSRPRGAGVRAVFDLASHVEQRVHSPETKMSRMTVNNNQEWSTRTFGNEDRLPRVPLPTVEETCERFLEWTAPLLTPEEAATTQAAVTAFLRPDSPAHKLHAALEKYNATEGVHSWLDTFWPSRYLGRRDRIALNANFFFMFNDSTLGQIDRAAGLIAAAVDYKLLLDAEAVPPMIQRGQALSMEQNKFLFSTTRIPGVPQDSVRRPYSDEWPGPSDARHIVVFVRGNMFRMEVIGPDGAPYALDDLAVGLQAAVKAGAEPAPLDTTVGHLTTKARADWAQTRHVLMAKNPGNAAAIDTIETALFCVCLDDLTPKDKLEACDVMLRGRSENRWFDKAVSLLVFADGTAGINVEHCGLDGTTILNFVDAILAGTPDEHAARSGARPQGEPPIEPVEFILDDSLRAEITAAADSFAQFCADTVSTVLEFDDFGGNVAKKLGVSPDAFVQLAYQLAHKRAKGHTGATYESIATRQYRHGRTEAMRVVTPEILEFVSAMDDPAADAAARRDAFRAAASKHVARAKECQAGQAPEQHLWELLLIQKRRGEALGATEPMALYETPGWLKSRDDFLSTSSAPSTSIQHFGFGSTSSQCIGVAYVLQPERFHLYLSTPRPVADGMHAFADRLGEAITELRELLAG